MGFNDDDIVFSEDYVNTFPAGILLQPGEYAYVRESILENALKTNPVSDFKFSVKADNHGEEFDKLDCSAVLSYSEADSYNNYVFVTFTNTTDSTLYNFGIAAAVYDQNGELIYVNTHSSSALGIHPGSTVTIKVYIDSDLTEYYIRNKIVPSVADAMVYV